MRDRRVGLQGAYNFRDLGGLSLAEGTSIAVGKVFRSDALHRLDASDVAVLESLRIGRVFDLRSDSEVARNGVGPLLRGAMRYHFPLVATTLSPFDEEIDWAGIDLQDRYLEMLSTGGEAIRAVLEAAASREEPPMVFHCTAGKDRTGIVAAVLLRAVGVDDEAIVDDYAVSERYLRVYLAAYRHRLSSSGLAPDVVAYLTSSPPQRMRRTLEALDRRWGSTRGYLDWIGVGEDTIARLRANLLR